MTPTEALAEALYLAYTAPTDEQADLTAKLVAAPLWEKLSELEVQRAQRMAEKRLASDYLAAQE